MKLVLFCILLLSACRALGALVVNPNLRPLNIEHSESDLWASITTKNYWSLDKLHASAERTLGHRVTKSEECIMAIHLVVELIKSMKDSAHDLQTKCGLSSMDHPSVFEDEGKGWRRLIMRPDMVPGLTVPPTPPTVPWTFRPTPRPVTSSPTFAPTLATRSPSRSPTKSLACKLFDPIIFNGVEVPNNINFFAPLSFTDGKSQFLNPKAFDSTSESILKPAIDLISSKMTLPDSLLEAIKVSLAGVSLMLNTAASFNVGPQCPISIGFGFYDAADRGVYLGDCDANMNLDPSQRYGILYVSVPKRRISCGNTLTCDASDYVNVCIAISTCPGYYAFFLNEGALSCAGVPGIGTLKTFGAGASLRVAYSNEGAVREKFNLFHFGSGKIMQFTQVKFDLSIALKVTYLIQNTIIEVVGDLALAIGGENILRSDPRVTFDALVKGKSENNLLVKGETSVRLLLDMYTAGILPPLEMPLKQINFFVAGKSMITNGETLERGLHFFYGPSTVKNAAASNYLDTLLLRLRDVVGSSLDFIGEDAFKGLKVGAAVFDEIIKLQKLGYEINQPNIGFHNNFGETTTLSLSKNIDFNLEILKIAGNLGLACTIGKNPIFNCKAILPVVTIGGFITEALEFLKDGAGYLLKQGGKIVAAVLDDVVNVFNQGAVITKKAYQIAAKAVKLGKKVMAELSKDAEALKRGIFACGREVKEAFKDCNFDKEYNWPDFSDIGKGNWGRLIRDFSRVPNNVEDVLSKVASCTANAADLGKNLGEGFAECAPQVGSCQKRICIPFVGPKGGGKKCCCGARVNGKCWGVSTRDCCGITTNKCQWNICVWNRISVKCSIPTLCGASTEQKNILAEPDTSATSSIIAGTVSSLLIAVGLAVALVVRQVRRRSSRKSLVDRHSLIASHTTQMSSANPEFGRSSDNEETPAVDVNQTAVTVHIENGV